jgi:hypothetical protein
MELPLDAPVALKRGITRHLKRNGALRRIEIKVKLGMRVAVEEIRTDPNAVGALERHRFQHSSPHELHALQVIYAFLSERSLTYTLSALEEESCVGRESAEAMALTDLVHSRHESFVCETTPPRGGAKAQPASGKRGVDWSGFLAENDEL